MLKAATNRLSKMFASGYDAIASSGKRKSASAAIRHEDNELKGRDRRKMIGTGQSLQRNFAILAWAIRKHLDYCTSFNFQMKTEDEAFNTEAERLWAEWSRPNNCDIAGRHNFPKFIRMLESRRVLDGDCFILKRSLGRMQAIEADRIQQPPNPGKNETWFNGVKVNQNGRATAYALHNRSENGGYEFSRNLTASNVVQHACYERFDQVRGISPLAAAYNSFQDSYEIVDYALAKLKVEQLFAMVITSAAQDGYGDHTKTADGSYDVDFGKGPVKLEMDPGDDAKFLGSDSPGTATQEFIHTVIGMAIKSLDLPFNFFDESHTNFFGSRAAWLLYDRSCDAKRDDVREVLRKIAIWRFQLWIQDGVISLPSGMRLGDLPFFFINKGMPWWDPAKEIKGDLMAINAGLDNPIRQARERGRGEYEDNIKQIAKAKQIADAHGVSVSFDVQPDIVVQGESNEE